MERQAEDTHPDGEIPPEILDMAVRWAVRMQAGIHDGSQRRDFDQWIKASPRHAAAWKAVQRVESLFSTLPPGTGPLLSSALKNTIDGTPQNPARRRGLLVLVGSILGAGSGLLWHCENNQPRLSLHTHEHEFLHTLLPDGTQLELNPETRIMVDYSLRDRRLTLIRGEIRVDTGMDPGFRLRGRPFQVDAPQARLVAIGTRFSVRAAADATTLEVEAGRVAMLLQGRQITIAGPGDRVRIDGDGQWQSLEVESMRFPSRAVRVLVAQSIPMERLLKQLSPFHDGLLACDPAAASLKVSGVFQLHAPDAVPRSLDLMTRTLPVRIERDSGGVLWVRLAE
ncbi:FecR family protein [Ectothiorhodospira shaposhnikovii]|uniref:FecR family protein n=1 Tax=Ectothiorhodospira shaposhnikovii TaxID=1054 RepID=UPI001904933D|nr:FecR domain-containing protein [Ectothiorhodospira shaposhnikovii]